MLLCRGTQVGHRGLNYKYYLEINERATEPEENANPPTFLTLSLFENSYIRQDPVYLLFVPTGDQPHNAITDYRLALLVINLDLRGQHSPSLLRCWIDIGNLDSGPD